MAKIQIDGKFYEVNTDRNLLETCLALGFDIPYFCNHPALGSVGACRLCAVKKFANADDKKGRIVMSCMEPVTEGMIVSVDDQEVRTFRAAVIEGLMTNHPHDCPICDEGGECHLQDMTVMTGHNYRQFAFKKRTYKNQFLGPYIQHEMNRCIQCYRCVRFYRDYSGGKDLNVFGSANHVYFGRQKDGVLESEFSGNLVEVCPTGVFTDKTLKNHYARKWDLTNSPSICVHCCLGCNIIVSERYGMVRRVMSRYNGSVNGYFLCDRGRFGYEFINNPERIKKICSRTSRESELKEVEKSDNPVLSESLKEGTVIGIGSPRASLESNFALSELVGKNNFFHGISSDEHELVKKAVQILRSGVVHSPSLKDIEKCDAVLILGEDVTNTSPMMALAIRQAARNKSVGIAAKLGIPKWSDAAVREMDQGTGSPVCIASSYSTRLDEIAEVTYFAAPEDIARLGFAVASALDPKAPVPSQNKEEKESAQKIAGVLKAAKTPLIITGTSHGNLNILNASANIAYALASAGKKPSLSFVFRECNSVGLAMLEGRSLDDAFELLNKDGKNTVIILENDIYARASKPETDAVFAKCRQVIVIDHLMNATARKADLVLPAATFAESTGTIINNEGRAQRFYSVLPEKEPVKDSWRWISELGRDNEKEKESEQIKFDDIVSGLVRSYPVFSGIKDQMPDAGSGFLNEKIARQNKRFSGRTAMDADKSVSEPKPPQDPDTPLNFSMEGFKGETPSSVIPFYWAPGWNSSQSMIRYMDEADGHLKEGGDPGIRIFKDTTEKIPEYFNDIPERFQPDVSELLIVPVNRIFGSEELSSKGEAIAGQIKEPFILLNEKEISRLHLVENTKFNFSINDEVIAAEVKKDNSLREGIAGLFCSTGSMTYTCLPARGKVHEYLKG